MAAYKMSQGDLYLLGPLVWQHYTDHQAVFGKYKKSKYPPTLGAEAVARLEAAAKLRNQQARGAASEMTRNDLAQQRDEFVDQWNLLDGYLEDAYRPADYKAMREAAGHDYYSAAQNDDWGAAAELVNQALTFVDDHLDTLKAKTDLDDDFVATLKAEGEDVLRVVRRLFKEQDGAEEATGEKLAANEACYAEFMAMCADGQRLFRRQPDVARQFQVESLLATVRGVRQAGIRGVVTDADGQEVAGVTITVKEKPGATTTTDGDGRYFLALASGTYTVVVGEKEISGVVVEVGVKKRVDVVAESAAPATARAATPPANAPPDDDELADEPTADEQA